MPLVNDPSIINVHVINDHALSVELDNHYIVELDLTELMKYSGYSKLRDRAFFNKVNYEQDMIYWDDMHDMHIHQILKFGKVLV